MKQGVFRSPVFGLVPWRTGDRTMGVQDDGIMGVGDLPSMFEQDDFEAILNGLAKGVGGGMSAVTSVSMEFWSAAPEDKRGAAPLDFWRSVAAAGPRFTPEQTYTSTLQAKTLPADGTYSILLNKHGASAEDFHVAVGQTYQTLWCNRRQRASRSFSEVALTALTPDSLASFAATPLAQTPLFLLNNLIDPMGNTMVNYTACSVLLACIEYGVGPVTDLLCDAFSEQVSLTSLSLHRALANELAHPEYRAAPVEFRTLMAF